MNKTRLKTYTEKWRAGKDKEMIFNLMPASSGINIFLEEFVDTKYLVVTVPPMKDYVEDFFLKVDAKLLKGGKLLPKEREYIKDLEDRITCYRWLLRTQSGFGYFLRHYRFTSKDYKAALSEFQSDLDNTKNILSRHNRLVNLISKARKAK
ncbi:hypothetical protein Ab1vBOLIVR5_gp45c [Agrobacterium phage OLIVR5]|uniref:Uncharacterized protein n=1 Tax=Agrobacterium phage OLIVR5 TaxID=2723773 RepID=A0A858MT40_9CAUD|nr:hypothetical protein KNU99_gp045 [Agrobacterium phage OLIVR5]QIW87693.1 hypothetical protein Ab1vBOLIVR5_gp45c [Agrobacterium phage OLIVR5]QIW87955.1 hypothetical protein Ab1vBOLIVR6_gp48c [Agrobacterium phage OLIVR6]